MGVDSKHIFSDGQAITTTVISDNVINLGSMGEAGAGAGGQMFINVYCDTAFSSDTETMDIWLVSSSAAVTAGSPKISMLVNAVAVDSVSSLNLAGKLVAKVPLQSTGLDQYIGLLYVATTALATGKLTAFLSYE